MLRLLRWIHEGRHLRWKTRMMLPDDASIPSTFLSSNDRSIQTAGLDMKDGVVGDMKALGVREAFKSKLQVYHKMLSIRAFSTQQLVSIYGNSDGMPS